MGVSRSAINNMSSSATLGISIFTIVWSEVTVMAIICLLFLACRCFGCIKKRKRIARIEQIKRKVWEIAEKDDFWQSKDDLNFTDKPNPEEPSQHLIIVQANELEKQSSQEEVSVKETRNEGPTQKEEERSSRLKIAAPLLDPEIQPNRQDAKRRQSPEIERDPTHEKKKVVTEEGVSDSLQTLEVRDRFGTSVTLEMNKIASQELVKYSTSQELAVFSHKNEKETKQDDNNGLKRLCTLMNMAVPKNKGITTLPQRGDPPRKPTVKPQLYPKPQTVNKKNILSAN